MNLITKFLFLTINFMLLSCLGQESEKEDFICNIEYEDVILVYDYKTINKDWLKEDIEFYKTLRRVSKEKPIEILQILQVEKSKNIDLGNGYSSVLGSFGVGYLSVYYHCVFKNDSLIAYKLNMPLKDILLLESNNLNPQETFKKTKGVYTVGDEYVFYHGYESACIPYKEIDFTNNVNDKMSFYMTPFSGINYGCRGGYGNGVLENRCAFKNLVYKQDLSSQDLIYIMHSINLTSRLTAIEYYTKNINQFDKEEKDKIDNLICSIFEEYGNKKVKILFGDIGYYLTIEDAVNRIISIECS